MTKKESLRSDRRLLLTEISIAAQHQVGYISPQEDMIMDPGMKSEVVMEEKENMVSGVMIEIVVIEIVIPKTLKTGVGEVVIGKMITEEGAEVLITSKLGHDVGVQIGNGRLRMMAILHHAAPPAYASADGVSAPLTVASTSAPPTSNSVEMNFLGSLADIFSSNALAIVLADSTSVEPNGQANPPSFSTSQPSTSRLMTPLVTLLSKPSLLRTPTQTCSKALVLLSSQHHQLSPRRPHILILLITLALGTHFQNVQPSSNSPDFPQEQFTTSQSDIDILAGVLPPSGSPASLPQQSGASAPTSHFPPSGNNMNKGFHPQPVYTAPNMPGQTPFEQAVQPYNMAPHSQNMTGASPFHSLAQPVTILE